MNLNKRKSIERNSSKTKKLRSLITDNQTITSIDQLSNEIFYEIFDYLDGYDIFQAFSNLNHRFQQILISLPFKISLSNKSSTQLANIFDTILISHSQQIISIAFDESFISKSYAYLQTFSQLNSLKIYIKTSCQEEFSNFYKDIFNLLPLKSHQLVVLTKQKLHLQLRLPTTNEQLSSLEYLNLSIRCDLQELLSILYYTPRLQCLICKNLIDSNFNINNHNEFKLLNLIKLRIKDCQIKFHNFEKFLQKISSHLQILHIDDYQNETLISPERWKQLISQSILNLITIRIKCRMKMIPNIEKEDVRTLDSNAISWFCQTYKCKFQFEIQPNLIFYVISSKNLFDSILELSINSRCARPSRVAIIDYLRPTLQTILFTSLHLFSSGMSVDNFMKLLNLLPNLRSLKLSSSLCFQNEDIELISHINQIVHVSLWMDFQHVKFLTKICSQMKYFEILGVKKKEFDELVEFILDKTTMDLTHLRTFRLYIYDANTSMIETIKSLIEKKQLLTKYHIERFDNVISLKW